MTRRRVTRHPLEAAKLEAWSWRLASILVIVVGLHQAWGLYEIYLHSERLPLWDMAHNGGQAVELADDVRYLRPARFFWHLNEHETRGAAEKARYPIPERALEWRLQLE